MTILYTHVLKRAASWLSQHPLLLSTDTYADENMAKPKTEVRHQLQAWEPKLGNLAEKSRNRCFQPASQSFRA